MIVKIGRHLKLPPRTTVVKCTKCVICAGFWNSHVHFTEPKWLNARTLPAARVGTQLQEMLTRWGFTTVVDAGSDPGNTVAIRKRIESGEIAGPYIYTAGFPLYPPHGLPFYLHDLPASLISQLPQPATPEEATSAIERNMAAGTDIVKVFTGSIIAPGQVRLMPQSEATAAVATAHQHHQIAFSHATNWAGVDVAVRAGVDVIAHAPEITDGFDDAYLKKMAFEHIGIIPTLLLFSSDSNIETIRDVLKRFKSFGGDLMFGTDAGFISVYDPEEEYRQLVRSDFSFDDILSFLTTNPAKRFGVDSFVGRVKVGMKADITVLAADPQSQSTFPSVKYTIRAGKVLYRGHE